jgi:flagellar hook assembly protein FlgD
VTEISFRIPTDEVVSLEIYDVSGRLVRTLVNGHRKSGPYTERWDGKDDAGRSVATGVYFYRMEAGSFNQTKRMVLLK